MGARGPFRSPHTSPPTTRRRPRRDGEPTARHRSTVRDSTRSECACGGSTGSRLQIMENQMKMSYQSFIASKAVVVPATGLDRAPDLHPALFAFQRDIVRWALRRGRACIFADCGLGKTLMQLEWARHVPGRVLVLTPLAVAQQTVAEAARFGIEASVSRDGAVTSQITISNYEMLHRFDPSAFDGVVLDESSILKSYDGRTRTAIIEAFRATPFRLACTATPAPNDHAELGNHAEFVGAMTRVEMLATFFCHDGGDTSVWRLKGHAEREFWRWMGTWAAMLRRPSDLGYADEGFALPALSVHEHVLESGIVQPDQLFAAPAQSLVDLRHARRATLSARVDYVARLVNESRDPWVVWCELNDEGNELAGAIPNAVQVAGADDDDVKADRMLGFARGVHRVLITKPSIGGFGMNWQHCSNMAFVGISHSYEQYYQATRRCWRFGQADPVNVHIITTDVEASTLESIRRKEADANRMAGEMVSHMSEIVSAEIRGTAHTQDAYASDMRSADEWTMHLGDCVDVTRSMASDSIHYSIFSPPFASLYTYSASDRDMGNCRTHGQFEAHLRFLIVELLRVTKSGRLLSFHCMNLPIAKQTAGYIGLADFRGMLIRAFADAGWIYHSEVCIWKDPVTAMRRTKALGLFHKQIKKDSCMSRQSIADYLVTMRKPGDNPERVTHTDDDMPVSLWQRYASPVWMDINPSETLQHQSAREDEDERHICPLQLQVIERAIRLWTNPGDLVLSPFAGIGSEGHVALREGRRFVGVELKRSYYDQACRNLAAATRQLGLF